MQKKLIALAVAGLVAAPVAMAQSNVTIYGVVDAAVVGGSQGDYDFTGVESGVLAGSRLGFRGTEDLGNGLKALFVLEYGLNVDTNEGVGTGGLRARQQFVGVTGDFGTFALGRQYAPGYFAGVAYNAVNSSAQFDPHAVLAADAGSSIIAGSNARWNNAATYTGSFAGLTVRGIWSANGVEMTQNAGLANEFKPKDDDAYGLGVDYKNGPLAVGVVYHEITGSGALNTTRSQSEWLLGGSYDFGMMKLVATYQQGKDMFHVSDNDVKIWTVGGIVPVSAAGNLHVSYGQSDFDNVSDGKAKSLGLAYVHSLSNRTKVYAGYNRVNNGNGTNAGFARTESAATTNGENQNIYGVGFNHSF